MPNFIKCLAYTEKYGCAILFVFKIFEYGISEPMTLVNCVVLIEETKLM
jgi:hypothetical protein